MMNDEAAAQVECCRWIIFENAKRYLLIFLLVLVLKHFQHLCSLASVLVLWGDQ